MNNVQIQPPEHLLPFVERFYIQVIEIEETKSPIPAMSSSFIMIQLGDLYQMKLVDGRSVSFHRMMAAGPVTMPSMFSEQNVRVCLLAARLRPGVLPQILPDGPTLVDGSCCIEDIEGVDTSICEAIESASNDKDRLELFTVFLEDLFKRYPAQLSKRAQLFEQAIHIIDEGARDLQVNDIADALDVSNVTLRNAFKVYAGMSPKQFLRIRRMEQVLRDFHKEPDPEYMVRVFGFYDQAHFIREFKTFCGITPLEFLTVIQSPEQHQIHNNLA